MIRCLLIDDDPGMLTYMRIFIEQTPFLKLVDAFDTPADALPVLRSGTIQLLFLDIGLPGLNGIELVKIMNAEGGALPLVILVSAFDSFAIEGYKINALDYLLKPITYDNFLQAAMKAKRVLHDMPYRDNDYTFFRVEYELIRVYLRDIRYIESFKDYVKVYTANGAAPIKALAKLGELEEKLPVASFKRIHRSFIVSLDKIESITKTSVRIGETVIPITSQYKENIREFMNRWF